MSSPAVTALLAYQFPGAVDPVTAINVLATVGSLCLAVLNEYDLCGELLASGSFAISGNGGTFTTSDTTITPNIVAALQAQQSEDANAFETFKVNLKSYIANI